ncbi:hypothetical protein LSH36_284g03001 [Paralvinella palmiformis]|uniref:Uncharacterized protein n=1 Tax=Paralvinella palmiformis TaxID=53620 RepID=A0AAD9JIH8_9ANNE|nr:hypothetical protein LSH36_284g03001 [Paralvinella palmiformis]
MYTFQELRDTGSKHKGLVITGGIGFGKTAIVDVLMEYSCFGSARTQLVQPAADSSEHNGKGRPPNGGANSAGNSSSCSQSAHSITHNYDSLKSITSHIVALHICQADNNITCMVPEFIHSIAAYMANSPQLEAYKEMLLQEPQIQNALCIRNCIQNPSSAFITGILEPLCELKTSGRITADFCVIVIDSLNEAEFHKPDYGDTIASFLTKHISKFPAWLKVIVTVRSMLQDLTKFLPFHAISLDKLVASENIQADVTGYINLRIDGSTQICNNIALNSKLDATTQSKFCSHVQMLSRGCLLYCKILLDLIEQGHLVVKSSNYKILPINLSEIFLLQFNLKFPTIRSFEKASPILNICLASLYPLTGEEIYETLNSGFMYRFIEWDDFVQRMSTLAGFLNLRLDGTYMYFHPAFREWLIRRDDNESPKFLCDLR